MSAPRKSPPVEEWRNHYPASFDRSVRQQRPERASLWIRYTPNHWTAPTGEWLDLAKRQLVRPGSQSSMEAVEPFAVEHADDVLYLPPVSAGARSRRDSLLARAREHQVPAWVQFDSAEAVSRGLPEEDEWVRPLVDPLAALLNQRVDSLADLPGGARVVYPLVEGLSSNRSDWEPALARLAQAKAAAAYPVTLELNARARRWLGERSDSESSYRSVFHNQKPSEREFAVTAASLGIDALPARPLPRAPQGLRLSRWVAGLLEEAAELWLALERPEAAGQSFFRAARHCDQDRYDLGALARDGNLRILEWLKAPVDEVVAELLESGSSRLLHELKSEYLTE